MSNMVIVLNAKSSNPQLVIDVGTKICGLRLTDDRILIVGDGMVIAWELSVGDFIVNTMKNIDSSTQITTLHPLKRHIHPYPLILITLPLGIARMEMCTFAACIVGRNL